MENCWFGLLLSEFEDRSHSKNHMFRNCFYYLRLKLCKQFIELSSTPSIFFLRRLGCMQSLIQLQLDLILLNSTWMCSPVPFCNPVEELVKIHDRDPWRTTSARLAVRSLRRWRTLQISMATLEYRLTQNPPPATHPMISDVSSTSPERRFKQLGFMYWCNYLQLQKTWRSHKSQHA